MHVAVLQGVLGGPPELVERAKADLERYRAAQVTQLHRLILERKQNR